MHALLLICTRVTWECSRFQPIRSAIFFMYIINYLLFLTDSLTSNERAESYHRWSHKSSLLSWLLCLWCSPIFTFYFFFLKPSHEETVPKRRSKFLPGYGRKVREFEFDLRLYWKAQITELNQTAEIRNWLSQHHV